MVIYAERSKRTQWIIKKPKACGREREKQCEKKGRHWRTGNEEELIRAQMHGLGFLSNT